MPGTQYDGRDAMIGSLRRLAYDQHGELYGDRFRAQMVAGTGLAEQITAAEATLARVREAREQIATLMDKATGSEDWSARAALDGALDALDAALNGTDRSCRCETANDLGVSPESTGTEIAHVHSECPVHGDGTDGES